MPAVCADRGQGAGAAGGVAHRVAADRCWPLLLWRGLRRQRRTRRSCWPWCARPRAERRPDHRAGRGRGVDHRASGHGRDRHARRHGRHVDRQLHRRRARRRVGADCRLHADRDGRASSSTAWCALDVVLAAALLAGVRPRRRRSLDAARRAGAGRTVSSRPASRGHRWRLLVACTFVTRELGPLREPVNSFRVRRRRGAARDPRAAAHRGAPGGRGSAARRSRAPRLAKLRRMMPRRRRSTYVSASTSTGLFEQTREHYGEIWYELDGRRAISRATTAEGVLETIYDAGRRRRRPRKPATTIFRGHPLAVPPRRRGRGVLRHLAGDRRGAPVSGSHRRQA